MGMAPKLTELITQAPWREAHGHDVIDETPQLVKNMTDSLYDLEAAVEESAMECEVTDD